LKDDLALRPIFQQLERWIEAHIFVGLHGLLPPREILKSVAANHQSIAKEPAPRAYIVNFAPGAVSLQLQAWTDRYEDRVLVRSDLSLAVDQALNQENITIA
jgi:hypothetical protein